MWKQALGSTLHCVSGDAAGVIIAATVTGLLGLPMWFDMTAEYVLGFAFGLFIFQALFMKDMMGGSYRKALTSSLIPEWVSMNAMMAGMFPTMVAIMMGRDMRAMDPRELLYWGTMSLAIGVGFLTAYPVNWWLVSKGLKHGLMTVRPAANREGSVLVGMDGTALLKYRMLHPLPLMRMAGTCTPKGPEMQSHQHREHRASAAQDHAASAPGPDGHAGMHVMGADVTRPQIAAVSLLTLLALIAGLLWSANYGNLTLGVHDVEGAVMAPGMIMTRDTPVSRCTIWRRSIRTKSASPRRPMPAATRNSRRASRTG